MTYNEIVSLMDRGFTAEQIMKLNTDPEQADPAPADPEPADPEPADPAPAPADTLNELMSVIKGMSAEISALKAAQQNSNINNIIRESTATSQTADDILAGFINPPYEKNENGGKTK